MSEFRAKSYFGQGVKFNGVDQEVDLGVFSVNGDKSTLMATFVVPSGSEDSYVVSAGGMGTVCRSAIYWRGATKELYLGVYNGAGFKYRTVTNLVEGDTYSVSFTYDHYNNEELLSYVDGIPNGELLGDTTSVWDGFHIGASYNSSGYSSSTIRNVVAVSGILTPTQIKYQYEYPETFLYREDDVLKSNILTQAEIDNVVAYLPMCEKDDYVRDLVSYSEDSKLDGFYTNNISGGAVITQSNTIDSYSLSVDTAGTNNQYPRTSFSFNEDQVVGVYYLVSFNYTVSSGTYSYKEYKNGGYGSSIVLSGSGTIDRVYKATNTQNTFQLWADGTQEFDIVFTDISVKKLTGIYPIANPTASCRDDANNLSTGLQTSKWKRDSLGVPYALSDYLECDGSGYMDTGWIPSADESFTNEIIFKVDKSSSLNQRFGATNNYIGRFSNGALYSNILGQNGLTNTYSDGVIHVIRIFNSIEKTNTLYINGVEAFNNIVNPTTQAIPTFQLGVMNTEVMQEPVRLFKVHPKTMTPQEVKYRYDKHVANGLLN